MLRGTPLASDQDRLRVHGMSMGPFEVNDGFVTVIMTQDFFPAKRPAAEGIWRRAAQALSRRARGE
jgi:hypothetical protein